MDHLNEAVVPTSQPVDESYNLETVFMDELNNVGDSLAYVVAEEYVTTDEPFEEQDHHCSDCNITFQSAHFLKKHIKINHSESLECFECTICNLCFARRTLFQKHMRKHTDGKIFKCSVCGKGFFEKQNLQRHELIHANIRNFACNICDKKFTQASNLLRHRDTHEGIRNFSCVECNKSFTQKANLKKHMAIHTSTKEYACQLCSRQFTQRANLDRHVKFHLGLKNFECDLCDLKFGQKANLLRHVKKVHDENKVKLTCPICNHKSRREDILLKHMETHKEKEEIRCVLCDMTFKQRRNFLEHVRIHVWGHRRRPKSSKNPTKSTDVESIQSEKNEADTSPNEVTPIETETEVNIIQEERTDYENKDIICFSGFSTTEAHEAHESSENKTVSVKQYQYVKATFEEAFIKHVFSNSLTEIKQEEDENAVISFEVEAQVNNVEDTEALNDHSQDEIICIS